MILFKFLRHEAGIVAAESEGVVGDGVDLHFTCLVADAVEVAVGVGGLVVDGRRHGVGHSPPLVVVDALRQPDYDPAGRRPWPPAKRAVAIQPTPPF